MSALLRIDQAGLPDGEPGKSRTDGLATGALVTLTDTGDGGSTEFALLWTPPGDTTAVASLAATVDPKVWTFSPTAGKYGSYLVALVRNAGLSSETTERRTLGIRTPWRRLLVPALNERGDKSASLAEPGTGELVDNNATDFPDADLNALPFASWWRAMHELIMSVDASVGIVVTHYWGTGLTRKTFETLAAALAVNYPSSIPSAAVYDLPPNLHNPTPGPITLDTIVAYVFRSTAGRGGVALPELTCSSPVRVEGCSLGLPIHGGGALVMREALASAAIECASLDARDSTFGSGANLSLSVATFDRCDFAELFEIECTALTDGVVTLINCTFGPSPTIEFTGDPGVVRMDARSNFLWDAAGGAVTNGSIVVEALP